MRNQILFFVLIAFSSIESYSQIIFENGYFINESNQKTECLIKNIEWKNNPTEFEYKLTQNANIQKGGIKNVKEFGITGVSKYIRALVKIDKSSDNINNMGYNRNPIFNEEELFLKVLIEGKASLFYYEKGNLTRFFFKTNDSNINQLVYKRYLIKKNNTHYIVANTPIITDNYYVTQNNYFRQQLYNDLKCMGITMRDVEYIKYKKRDLKRFFTKYNECINTGYIDFEPKQKKDLFNLSFRPGINLSNLAIQNSIPDPRDTDFGNELSFRFGIESEYILPFNKNKWGVIIEPTYQYYKSEKSKEAKDVSGGILISKINYHSIALPIGIRHYFHLNDDSKIFANISHTHNYSRKSSFDFSRIDGSSYRPLDAKERSKTLDLGIGYKYKDRYSLEIRYQTKRNIVNDYINWYSEYKIFSVIFGISLF